MPEPSGSSPTPSPSLLRAWVMLALAIVVWSLPPIFVRQFADYFDPVTQSTFRYLFLIVWLWGYGALLLRRQFRAYAPDWGLLVTAAVCIVIYQLSWVTATYFLMPALMHLLLKLNVITGPVMTWIWEHGERDTLRRPRFVIGSLLSLLGAAGLIHFGEGHAVEAVRSLPGWSEWECYAAGVGLCVLAAFMWPGYSICAKRLAGRGHPMVVYTYIGTASGVVFLAISAAMGQLHQILAAPPWILVLLAASGIVCMGIAHGLYMVALRELGVAVCVLGLLLAPLLTCAWSWAVFGETLAGWQWPSALLLLGGCALAILTRPRPGPPPQVLPGPAATSR